MLEQGNLSMGPETWGLGPGTWGLGGHGFKKKIIVVFITVICYCHSNIQPCLLTRLDIDCKMQHNVISGGRRMGVSRPACVNACRKAGFPR